MSTPSELLRTSRHVVVQDFPDAAVPEALARAGLRVTIYGGPDEADVIAGEWRAGHLESHPVGRRPDRADLIYVYRPLAELDAVVAEARRIQARAVWRQPQPDEDTEVSVTWRTRVESAGLIYLDEPDIAETAAALGR